MAVFEKVVNILKWGLLVGFVAGFLSVLLSWVLPGLMTNVWTQVIVTIAIIVALVGLAKSIKIDDVSVFDLVILLATVALFGSIFTALYPPVATYILNINNSLTVSSLLFTFLYVGVAEYILTKAGVKLTN